MLPRQAKTAGSVILLLIAFTPWGAFAQSVMPEVPPASELRIAAERFDQGRDAYRAGIFAEAAEHFEAADRRAPSASALGLAMRSRDEAGQLLRAANLAELVLVRYPGDAELTDSAKEIITSATAASARVHITCEPACEMVVDRRLSHGGVQPSWVLYLEPGQHVLSANFSGSQVVTKPVSVEVGDSANYTLEAPQPVLLPRPTLPVPQPPASPRPVTESRKPLSPTWFWIGVGTTTALSAATLWSGVDAQNNPGPDVVRRECAGLGEACDLYQQGQRKELRTNLLLGASAASAVATVAIGALFTEFSGRTPPRAGRGSLARVRPWCHLPVAPGGFGREHNIVLGALLGAEGRF